MEKYWFDEQAAARAVLFFEKYIRLTTGEWAGKPFKLSPSQAHHVGQIFGWKRTADNMRRYRRVLWWEPRKNGKTELIAGIGHLLTVGDGEPGAEVYSHALDEKQAKLSFERGARMVHFSPALRELYEVTKEGMYCPASMSVWRALSGVADGKHGLSAHGLLGDEAHEWKSPRLHTFLKQSVGSRRQPLDFIISTAGERNGYGWELWQISCKIRDGLIDDPETYVVIYAADPEDDWTDPKVWAKANPNLGVSLKLSYLEAACKEAQENPRKENDFKRYHLNLWVEQAVRWIQMANWRKCSADPANKTLWKDMDSRLAGRECYGGLDLAQTSDINALVWWFPPTETETAAVLCRFWVPEATVGPRSTRDRVPYDLWVREGAVQTTPGNVTDYREIKAQIMRDAEKFRVKGLAIDRWNATQVAVELQEDGLEVHLYGQGMASMSAPSKELERLILQASFDHGNHPVLDWMAANAACEQDAAGNIKPAKNKSAEKIDGVVAMIMGIGIAMAHKTEEKPGSYLESMDMVIL